MAFWKSTSIMPHDGVSDFKARIFNGTREAVIGARTAERDDVSPGFQNAQHLSPESRVERHGPVVPLLSHEAARTAGVHAALRCGGTFLPEPLHDTDKRIGWIGNARINRAIRHGADNFGAVTVVDSHYHVSTAM